MLLSSVRRRGATLWDSGLRPHQLSLQRETDPSSADDPVTPAKSQWQLGVFSSHSFAWMENPLLRRIWGRGQL